MYEKCINCEHLGKDCIPNLYVMSVSDIKTWAKKLKDYKGWTNAHLAEVSGVPKGTIDCNFSNKKTSDVNYSTFAPVICALIESDMEEMPCNIKSSDYDDVMERISYLENENHMLTDKLNEMNNRNEDYENRINYFKEHIKYKQKIISILIIISCVLVSFILIEIVIDWCNSGIGFFWR